MFSFFKNKKFLISIISLLTVWILFYYLIIQSSLTFSEEINQQAKLIDKDKLKTHVKELSQIGSRLTLVNNTPHYNESRRDLKIAYITNEMESYGYSISKEEFTRKLKNGLPDAIGVNLFATKTGIKEPSTIIEIGAHYDTRMDSPGADDNSSGISGILEIARNVKTSKLNKSIRFCFFDLEEYGLYGSREHVSRLKNNTTESVQEIIVLEMIGYASEEENSQTTPIKIPFFVEPPTTGNFISFVSNWQSRETAYQFEDAAKLYGKIPTFGLKVIGGFLNDADRSDHYPYWLSNYRAIMITDTANFRNHHYHQKTDTHTTLNYKFMQKVTIAVYALLLHKTK